MEEDSSNHEQVKISLLPEDDDDVILLNHHHHHHAKPSACPPSLSLSLPPPPFQISHQEHEHYNNYDDDDDDTPPPTTTNFLFDHEPHHPLHYHPRFMTNFLIALTTGLLFISVISTFKTLETTNLFPNFVVQSASVKSLTLINPSSSSSSVDVAASNLTVSLRIENPHRFSLSYSSLKASAFQGCDLLGVFDLSLSDQKVKHLEIGARSSTDLELGFGIGVRLRVEDWIARDLERDTGIGVAAFGMQMVVGEAADDANKLEIRCGTVFLGFSTDPFAGKLLFGPARCWRVTGGSYGSTCF